MDQSRLSELKRIAGKVVREAQKPGGSLEKNEFTMGLARRLISEQMGLGDDGLDESKWKKIVKEHVMHCLENEEDQTNQAGPSRSPSPPPVQKSKPATSKREKVTKPEPVIEDEKHESSIPEPVPEPSIPEPVPEPAEVTKTDDSSKTAVDGEEDGNESDESSVYDIPPPKRRKKGEDESEKPEKKNKRKSDPKDTKKRTKKDPDEGLSPDEAKVAELKRIVVACGVRKQWSKEFAEYPSPKDQIRRLNLMLSELGMKGHPTLGKAKSLKEKRELAAELDDVREFESKRGLADRRASRSAAKKSGLKGDDVSEDDDEDEEEEGGGGEDTSPPDPKESALGSIMDFLGDQSD